MRILSTRVRRVSAVAIAAVAIAAGGAASAQSSKPSTTSFDLFPNNPAIRTASPLPEDAHAKVHVQRGKFNDQLELEIKNFKPDLDFDVFTVENSPQLSDGTANPNFKGTSASPGTSPTCTSNQPRRGHDHAQDDPARPDLRLRRRTSVPPSNTFNVGFWFNNPADAAQLRLHRVHAVQRRAPRRPGGDDQPPGRDHEARAAVHRPRVERRRDVPLQPVRR